VDHWYSGLRALHIGAATASGALFLMRALAVNLAGATWPMTRPVRILSYLVDTVLLAAAIALTTIIHQYPLADGWLSAKLLLLILYILLGYRALRGPSRAARLVCLVAAVVVFLFIVSVAHAHDPLGLLART
jgi:uncharacterized membrane protein SirB2